MKWKAMLLTGAAMVLIGPAAASACDTYLAYTFKRITGSPLDLGGGLQIQPAEGGGPTFIIPSVDLSFGLGDKAVLRPAIGLCTTAGGTQGAFGQSDTDVVFGGAIAWNVWNAPGGNLGVNLQTAVTHASRTGGSQQTIPITAAGEFRASDEAALFLGGGIQIGRTNVEGSPSSTASGPVGFAGTTLNGGALDFTVAIQVMRIEQDTDIAINAAFTVPIG